MPGSVRSESPTKTWGSRFIVFQRRVWHSPTPCHSGACTVQFVSICQTAVSITKENAGTTESFCGKKNIVSTTQSGLEISYLSTQDKNNLKQFTPPSVVVHTWYIILSNNNKTSLTGQNMYHLFKSAPTHHSSLKVWMGSRLQCEFIISFTASTLCWLLFCVFISFGIKLHCANSQVFLRHLFIKAISALCWRHFYLRTYSDMS